MIRRIALCALLVALPAKPIFQDVKQAIQDKFIKEVASSFGGMGKLVAPTAIGASIFAGSSLLIKKTSKMSRGSRLAGSATLGILAMHWITEGSIWNELTTIRKTLEAFRLETTENFEKTWNQLDKIQQQNILTSIRNSIMFKLIRQTELTQDEKTVSTWLEKADHLQKISDKESQALQKLIKENCLLGSSKLGSGLKNILEDACNKKTKKE